MILGLLADGTLQLLRKTADDACLILDDGGEISYAFQRFCGLTPDSQGHESLEVSGMGAVGYIEDLFLTIF